METTTATATIETNSTMTTENKVITINGKTSRASEFVAELADTRARLTRITDAFAVEIATRRAGVLAAGLAAAGIAEDATFAPLPAVNTSYTARRAGHKIAYRYSYTAEIEAAGDINNLLRGSAAAE